MQHPRESSLASSDIAYEKPDPNAPQAPTQRSIKLPSPAPTNHDDVAPWRSNFLDVLAASNTKNIDRERTYWDKPWTWDVDDPRLVNNPIPPDMLTLEVIFR